MGRMKQHPRYNVLSFRASDEKSLVIEAAINGGSKQAYLLEAVLEKIQRDEQYAFTERLNSALGH